jgi:Leucine-rich repeat (LRR) protein
VSQAIVNIVLLRSPASEQALSLPSSVQSQALTWLVENDADLSLYTEVTFVQRWALATFGLATQVNQWVQNNGWLDPEETTCDWEGVECDEAGNVLSLDLEGNRLTGQLPVELAVMFETLTSLNVGNNRLSGELPAWLGLFQNLVELRVDRNELSGTIPAEIGALVALQVFKIDRNGFTGPVPDTIASLENLRELTLNTNFLTGVLPDVVCQFPNLVTLVLDCLEVDSACWTQCFYQCGGNTGVACDTLNFAP